MNAGKNRRGSQRDDAEDTYPVVIEVAPQTSDGAFQEIGALGSLLIQLVQNVFGSPGCISVVEHLNGVRFFIELTGVKSSTCIQSTRGDNLKNEEGRL